MVPKKKTLIFRSFLYGLSTVQLLKLVLHSRSLSLLTAFFVSLPSSDCVLLHIIFYTALLISLSQKLREGNEQGADPLKYSSCISLFKKTFQFTHSSGSSILLSVLVSKAIIALFAFVLLLLVFYIVFTLRGTIQASKQMSRRIKLHLYTHWVLHCEEEEKDSNRISGRKKEQDAILWEGLPSNPVRDYVYTLILFDCTFRAVRVSFTEKLKI